MKVIIALTSLLVLVAVVGCDAADEGGAVAGDYATAQFLAPGALDGLDDVLAKGTSIEMVLTSDGTIESGRYVRPWESIPADCVPDGEEIFRFSGSYSVVADTVTLMLQQDCYSLLHQSRWLREEGALRYVRDSRWAFEPVIELKKK